MHAEEILREISDFCRRSGLAESTFGRRAVNDGKLVSRLREKIDRPFEKKLLHTVRGVGYVLRP